MSIKETSLLKMMPYWENYKGIMLLENGLSEVGVQFTLPPGIVFDAYRAEALNNGLKALLRNCIPEGKRMRLIIEAVPAGRQHVSDSFKKPTDNSPNSRLFAQKRLENFSDLAAQNLILKWNFYLTLEVGRERLAGSSNVVAQLLQKVFKGMAKEGQVQFTSTEFQKRLEDARIAQNAMLQFLNDMKFQPRPMDQDDVFALCHRYFNPDQRNEKQNPYTPAKQFIHQKHAKTKTTGKKEPSPNVPSFRSKIAQTAIDCTKPEYLLIGNTYVTTVGLANYPQQVFLSMADSLYNNGGAFYYVVDWVHLSHEKSMEKFKSKSQQAYALAGADGYVDPNVHIALAETSKIIAHVAETGDHIYETGATMVLMDTDLERLQDRSRKLISSASAIPGNPFSRYKTGTNSPYFDAAPFNGRRMKYRIGLLESHAITMFPVSGPWSTEQDPKVMFHSPYLTMVGIDPFNQKLPNWNSIVIGGSASGKTFSVNLMLSQMLGSGCQVIIIDRGGGYTELIETLPPGDAVKIDLAPGGTSINMFDLAPGQHVPDDSKLAELTNIILSMAPNWDLKDQTIIKAIILEALKQTYSIKTQYDNLNGVEVAYYRGWDAWDGEDTEHYPGALLRDFQKQLNILESLNGNNASEEVKLLSRQLAIALSGWLGDTPFGQMLDRPTSIPLSNAKLVCYETTALSRYPELQLVATLLIAQLTWTRVQQNLDTQKIVVLDEAFALLKIGPAAAFIVELFRRIRKYNASIWAISQNIDDFTGELVSGILECTTSLYVLKSPGQEERIGRTFNLPDSAIGRLRHLRRVDGQYSEMLIWLRQEEGDVGDVVWVRPSQLDFQAFNTSARFKDRLTLEKSRSGNLTTALLRLAYPNRIPETPVQIDIKLTRAA